METLKVKKLGNVTILSSNVNGKDLEKIKNADLTPDEVKAQRIAKTEALLAKIDAEEAEKAKKRKDAILANLEAILEKEEAKEKESKVLESKRAALVEKINAVQLLINPLVEQMTQLKKELSSLKGAKVSFSSGNVIKSVKETSVFGFIQKFITDAGSEGIGKDQLFDSVRAVKENVSDESIKWSISQLGKKTDFQFSVTDGIYFAK